jgi:hypothetical protein
MSRVLPCLLLCLLTLAFPASPTVADETSPDVLQIDPLLIAHATEVWTLLTADENPLWPDWRGVETPILFYLPGRQDVLINHPSPPDGFVPYTGPIRFPAGQIFVRNGETLINMDGQNTSLDVHGQQTLVVADTFSNLRNSLDSLMEQAAAKSEAQPLSFNQLENDAYSTMGMIAHEAFHVFQHQAVKGKSGNEMALTQYPTLSVTNNVGFALEGRLLAAALREADPQARRDLALKWLAVREWRRSQLTPADVAYEDGTEFNEGLAKYIEYRLLQVLEGREPGDQMKWVRGFKGYRDLSAQRQRMLDMMTRHLEGKVSVNNDPYGASPLRMRMYFSGMAVAALLDAIGDPTWHASILEPGTTLTSLARAALAAKPDELASATAAIPQLPDYESITRDKQELHDAGQQWIAAEMAAIEGGKTTSLEIDYSQIPDDQIAMSFTPFGIVAVDSDRAIFRLIPITAKMGDGARFQQTRPSPVLQDRKSHRFTFALSERISREQLVKALDRTELPTEPVTVTKLELPGVQLQLQDASVQWQDDRVVVTLGSK